MPFVKFYYDQRMASFLAGHIAAFEFFTRATMMASPA
ncbi:MAG: hypothetical protein ACI9MC_000570 [Kiritimatiellia bacterium]|jgi:hypothetical protein